MHIGVRKSELLSVNGESQRVSGNFDVCAEIKIATCAPGHRTDYQRVLSRAPWSALALGCALAGFLLTHLVPEGDVILVGDDTVDGHPGKKVYGKARHRDPVRSTHSHTAWRYGHKWVVLAVLVRFPFATRPWALPVLIDLYRSEEDDRARNRPHPNGDRCCRVRSSSSSARRGW